MAKFVLLLSLGALVMAGCGGGESDEYTDKAPPASSDAQAVTPPANKVRMGNDGPMQAGGGEKPMQRPAGL